MKDKMFGRPIVELPPIHPVGRNSQLAHALFVLAKIFRTHNISRSLRKREHYIAFSKTDSGIT
jgi:hypothetical protein